MYNYHCSKCKKPCQKKDSEWTPNCDCGIRCSPSWSPPSAAAFSEGIKRAFSLTEPEPEPIGEWLSQGSMDPVKEIEVKKGVKVVPTRMEKRNPDKPSVRAYRVKKGVKVVSTHTEGNSDKSKMKSKNKSRKSKTKRRKSRNKSKRRKSRNKFKRRKRNK